MDNRLDIIKKLLGEKDDIRPIETQIADQILPLYCQYNREINWSITHDLKDLNEKILTKFEDGFERRTKSHATLYSLKTILEISQATSPSEILKIYNTYGTNRKWYTDNLNEIIEAAVIDKFKKEFKEADFEEIEKSLEEGLLLSGIAPEKFSMEIIKHILADQRQDEHSKLLVDKALFSKPNYIGISGNLVEKPSRFDRFMSPHFVVPSSHPEQVTTHKKLKKLLSFVKAVKNMKEHGEKILKKDKQDKKGQQLVRASNELRSEIPTMTIGGGESANRNFTDVLQKYNDDLSQHRGWRRVMINVALCIGGLGIFYAAAVGVNAIRTKGKHFALFYDTKSNKKADRVAAEIRAVNQP